MTRVRVLTAPDSFTGTLTAVEAADAIAAGWRRHAPDADLDLAPMSDGGPGFLDAVGGALGGTRHRFPAVGPLGAPLTAEVLQTPDRTVYVEAALACGLDLVPAAGRRPLDATSAGVGDLLVAALDALGPSRVVVGVGGTASTDGGRGCVESVGGLGAWPSDVPLVAATDVDAPLLGPSGAAVVFGPQKGAGRQDVRRLTSRLHGLARAMKRDPRGVPMTGAAGGLAGGLWAELEAELVPGAAFVLDAVAFDSRMKTARAVVTGEGRLDLQSLAGKAVSEVATRARQSGVPCHAIVGARELDTFGARILDLQAILEAGTRRRLETAGARLAELL